VTAKPWYSDGLKFTCTQCGNCCTGAPGFVWVSAGEIAALARRLGIDQASFRARYTRVIAGSGISLKEIPEVETGNSCVFFKRGAGCTVYADRPRQCRTWPFWRSLVASPAAWKSHARGCPGMDHGSLHPATHIAATAARDGLL